MANPVLLLDDPARVESTSDPTGRRGVGFRGVSEGSLAHGLGLREGDLLLSVNGLPIRSVEDVGSAVLRLRDARIFSAEIVRDGRTISRRWTLK